MKIYFKLIMILTLLISINSSAFAIQIDKDKSLVITDLGVVEDSLRTVYDSNNTNPSASVWTFGRLVENMSGATNASDFVMNWLEHWQADQNVNGFVSVARPNIRTAVIDPWLDASALNGSPSGTLDLSIAPFRLLSIVNRLDLRKPGNAGEGRFVFGVTDQAGNPFQFTVIFEYELPASSETEVRQWAIDWSNLTTISDPAAYNVALQNITDRFTGKDTMLLKPNGNAINQIRTNEIRLTSPWELREFVISPITNLLVQNTVNQTPDFELRESAQLESFLNLNAPLILKERHEIPQVMLGASALTPISTPWAATLSNVDDEVKHKFAVNTCNGCHRTETDAFFLHVSNRVQGSEAILSSFMTGINSDVVDPRNSTIRRSFNDIQRRLVDVNNVLHVKSDLNGDGRSDVLFRNMDTGLISIWQMNGFSTNITSPVNTISSIGDKVVGSGDIDGDNTAESIVYNKITGEVRSLSLNSLSSIGNQSVASNQVVGVADLNGDASDEIIWFDDVSGIVTAWNMAGSGVTVHNVGLLEANRKFRNVSVDDTNGDGLAEVIWSKVDTNELIIWETSNFIKSNEHVLTSPGVGWVAKGSGDFDRDGKSDIVWLNQITAEVLIWEMANFTSVNNHIIVSAQDLSVSGLMAIGDYNADGNADMLWRNLSSGDVIQWKMHDFVITEQQVMNPRRGINTYIAPTLTGSVRGRINLDNGETLAGIELWNVIKFPEKMRSDVNGLIFSLGYTSVDPVWLNYFAAGTMGHTLTPSGWDGDIIWHDGSAITNINFTATQKPGTVTGRIMNSDGTPLVGHELWDVFKFPETVTTQADGRFIIIDFNVDDGVFLNPHGNPDLNVVPTGSNTGDPFQHDGAAIKNIDYLASPK